MRAIKFLMLLSDVAMCSKDLMTKMKKFDDLNMTNQPNNAGVLYASLSFLMMINTASHKKGTASRVENSEFQIFCYWVMGPYEETPMTPKILVPAALGGPNGPFLVPK